MEIEEYPSNSQKSKERIAGTENRSTEKRVQKPVAVGRLAKKSKAQEVLETFVSDDISDIKSYIVMDVLVPSIKKAISDIVINGIDMLLYPNGGGRSKNGSRVSYRSCYHTEDERHERKAVYTVRDYDNITLDTRGEAEDILTSMDELISVYGIVSVADLYDLVGIVGSYTDNKYGWTNLKTAKVIPTRDGYKLKLPRAIPLD